MRKGKVYIYHCTNVYCTYSLRTLYNASNGINISGAKGLVAFPNETLHATTFIQTLKNMHEKKKFHQMVIYIEACESGSMFKGLLPKNINIYGTTASNSTHSSVSFTLRSSWKCVLEDHYELLRLNLLFSMRATMMIRLRHFWEMYTALSGLKTQTKKT